MTHYLSCGHELLEDEEGNEVYLILSVKTEYPDEQGWNKAILYGSYCLDCAKELEEDGWVLHNEEDEMEWLVKPSETP